MRDGHDIDRYVKDPSLLAELCREVIDELDAANDDSDVGEREAQLREIAKTIERLEKAGVSFLACKEIVFPRLVDPMRD